jgi:opacity protein-like surface antigen
MKKLLLVVLFLSIAAPLSLAQAPAASGQLFVVEYYYKARWGHADEFSKLFKKNHYPLLKKEVEMGRMLKV